MSTAAELREAQERFKSYIDQLKALLRRHEIASIAALISAVRSNDSFRKEWRATWRKIAEQDGGKVSLTTAGAILGAALGGVGIAAMGGAIGLPLAALLGVGGFVAGVELDSFRRLKGLRPTVLGIPRDLYTRLEEAAKASDVDVNGLIIGILSDAFPERRREYLEPVSPAPGGV